MLRILGSPKTLCGGMTRRELLHVGGLGLAGLALPDLLRAKETAPAKEGQRPPSFGRAKSIILLHLWGSPSQLETFDPKPDAPVEIRGELIDAEVALWLHAGMAIQTVFGEKRTHVIIGDRCHPGWRFSCASRIWQQQENERNHKRESFHGTEIPGGEVLAGSEAATQLYRMTTFGLLESC